MNTSNDHNELFEKELPGWQVITIHRKQTKLEIASKAPREILRHELLYGGKVETSRKGEGGLKQLHEMAKFMNSRGMVPRKKIECLADKGIPALPHKKKPEQEHAPETADEKEAP